MGLNLQRGSEVIVLGAGIVGVCCAAELIEAGFRVTVIDRGDPGMAGPSKANAGHIAAASILPIASPQTLRNLPGLLFNANSPLSIPPRNALRILPWLFRFGLSCRKSVYMNGVAALASLSGILWDVTEGLYARAGISDKLGRTGALFIYESQRSYESALKGWEVSERFGIDFEPVRDPHSLAPRLAIPVAGAIRTPMWGLVSDPLEIITDIARHVASKGGVFLKANVRALQRTESGVEIATACGMTKRADAAVIAAGAWSGELAERLGDRVPLEVERGYNITIPGRVAGVSLPLVLADRGIVTSPLSIGLRVGGLDELGGLDLPPNPELHARIFATARSLFPDLDVSGAVKWMGHRPSTPDSLPVIGCSKLSPQFLYAFGHGHLGLTHAPATGKIIADLAAGRKPPIDISAFDSTRFRRLP